MNSKITYDEKCINAQVDRDNSINEYQLNRPDNNCINCYPANPEIRFQKKAGLEDVSVENNLLGLNRKNTCYDMNEEKSCESGVCPTQKFDNIKNDVKDCDIKTTNTRFESTSNLKEMAVNRWEWLPIDPQQHALSEISVIGSRNFMKDQYSPNFIQPEDHTNEVHYDNKQLEEYTKPVKISP